MRYLNAGRKYCRMLHGSILQYFWPAFIMGLENLFYGFRLSGRLRQILLYIRRDIDEV